MAKQKLWFIPREDFKYVEQAMADANPCRCGATNLKPKMESNTGVGWIHCDTCGNTSEPVALILGGKAVVEQWNQETGARAAFAMPVISCEVTKCPNNEAGHCGKLSDIEIMASGRCKQAMVCEEAFGGELQDE